MAADFIESARAQAAAVQADLPGAELEWLRAARARQLEAFARDGLPDQHDEPWKYTSLRAFARRPHAPRDAAAATREVDPALLDLPGDDGPCIVFVHGVFRPDLSRLDALPAGVELASFAGAIAGEGALLQTALEQPWPSRSDVFSRLNTALATDGMVLRVAAGTELAAPLHVLRIGLAGTGDFAWHLRDVIGIGAGARVTLVEHHRGDGACNHFATRLAHADIADGARFEWTVVQEAGEGETLIRRDELRLGAGADVSMHAVELGGGLVRHDFDARLVGDGARLATRGVFLPHGRQHMDTQIDIRHDARDTWSDSLWRGVADERGHGILHGAIVVAPGADGTDANLNNKNLLLSRQAEIDSQPVLEIYADEVMAEHGATVGQLDEQALFYMRTRGIPPAQARAMLTAAFCHAGLDGITDAGLLDYCTARLRERLPDADAHAGTQA